MADNEVRCGRILGERKMGGMRNMLHFFMYIRTLCQEEVWLAMSPLVNDENDYTLLSKTGNTCMSSKHTKMMCMFMLFLLSKLLDLSVDLLETYGRNQTMFD